jgi:hypothetical protein
VKTEEEYKSLQTRVWLHQIELESSWSIVGDWLRNAFKHCADEVFKLLSWAMLAIPPVAVTHSALNGTILISIPLCTIFLCGIIGVRISHDEGTQR